MQPDQQPVFDTTQQRRRYPEKYIAVEKTIKTKDKKVRFVMYLFSDGPREYDFLLKILSLGRDKYWRRSMLDATRATSRDKMLDVACGTGLVSFELAARKKAQVVGIDVTREMLVRANQLKRRYESSHVGSFSLDVDFVQARAENLPLRDDAFAAATISLAMRNVSSIPITISEMTRCVRPGGRVMSMDFTMPNGSIFRHFYGFYIFDVLPSLGLVVSRHWNGILSYLARSIKRSKSPEQIRETMQGVGLANVTIKRMTHGVTALTMGSKNSK